MKRDNIINFAQQKIERNFERALSGKPIEEQLAASIVTKNVFNGCSWEFCRMDSVLRRYETEFAQSKTCRLQKVTYNREQGVQGYLVYMQMDRLLELIGQDNRGPLLASDLEIVKQRHEDEIIALLSRIKSGYTGKIAIYYTSDCQTITIQGRTLPAYAVTLQELCFSCLSTGYGVVIGGEPRDPKQILQKEDAVIESLLLAPSSNGLFIDIAPMKVCVNSANE